MKKALVIIAAVLILSAAVVAWAQWGDNPGPPGPGKPGPMIGPPATIMVADGDSLYILRGNVLTKVKKADLEVVVQKMLPMPKPPEPPPGQ